MNWKLQKKKFFFAFFEKLFGPPSADACRVFAWAGSEGIQSEKNQKKSTKSMPILYMVSITVANPEAYYMVEFIIRYGNQTIR